MVVLQDDAVFEKRGDKECRVSGHRIEIGRDKYQIILRVDGANWYHNDFESALKALRNTIGDMNAATQTVEQLFEHERAAWAEVKAIAEKLDSVVKPILNEWKRGSGK
jgi:hypothetical protein